MSFYAQLIALFVKGGLLGLPPKKKNKRPAVEEQNPAWEVVIPFLFRECYMISWLNPCIRALTMNLFLPESVVKRRWGILLQTSGVLKFHITRFY